MHRIRRTRASGREQAIHDLNETPGLEGEPIPRETDRALPLRPFASTIPRETGAPAPARVEAGDADRLLDRANDLARRGRTSDAMVAYRETLHLDPASVDARLGLAHVHEERDEGDDALDQLSEVLSRHPGRVETWIARGELYIRLQRYKEAEADFRRAIRLEAKEAKAHFGLGVVLWRRGLAGPAAECFATAVRLDPEDGQAHYYLGEALNQAGDPEDAFRALERATALDPTEARAWQLLGRLLDRQHRTEEALEMYRRAREAGRR